MLDAAGVLVIEAARQRDQRQCRPDSYAPGRWVMVRTFVRRGARALGDERVREVFVDLRLHGDDLLWSVVVERTTARGREVPRSTRNPGLGR